MPWPAWSEPESLDWVLPLFAVTFLDNSFVPFLSFSPDQTPATGTQYKGSSCPVDDAVTVIPPETHRQSLEVIVTGGRFWRSTGNSESKELQLFLQPESLQYVDPDGRCHEHWVIPGGRQATGTPDIDPEDPGNSTSTSWQNNKSTFSVPFNITQPSSNDNDLDATGNPLASLFPAPYPLIIKPPESDLPILPQDSIWLSFDTEKSLVLVPSEFPALIEISRKADSDWLQFIEAEFLFNNDPDDDIEGYRLINDPIRQQSEVDDPLLRLLVLFYGAVFHAQDSDGQSFYIIRHNGRLFRISKPMIQRWFSQYSQSQLEWLYPEVFDHFLPAGGGWHKWNDYVRKVSGRGQGNKVGRPFVQPGRQGRIERDQATGQPTPVQESRHRGQRGATERQPETVRKTDAKKIKSQETAKEVTEQLKQAERLYRKEEYDQCIGVLIRIHMRMDSAGISRTHDHREWLTSILNDAIFEKIRVQVIVMADRNDHKQALRRLRPLKLIPLELLSKGHIDSMETAAHVSGGYTYRPAIDRLHQRLKDLRQNKGADLSPVRQSAVNVYLKDRLVMSKAHRTGLSIAWCQALRPLLDHVKHLQSTGTPREAFNQIGPHVIKFVDLLGVGTDTSKGALSRVRGMLEDIISQTLAGLEAEPESTTPTLEFRMEWVLFMATNKHLIDEKPLRSIRKRLTALQQPRMVSVQKQYRVSFTPLYDYGNSRSGVVNLRRQSVLELMAQVDRYLRQGLFGNAIGLIIQIHRVTEGALPYNTKARLYSQLRSAAYPLLYDLTVEVSVKGWSENSQRVFHELRTGLGELEFQLAASQSYAMFWLKRLFPAAPPPEAKPPPPATPPWLEAIESSLTEGNWQTLMKILKTKGVNPNSKALSSSVRTRLREIIRQAMATLSQEVQQALSDTQSTIVDNQLQIFDEMAQFIDEETEIPVTEILRRRQALMASQKQLDTISTLLAQGNWQDCVALMQEHSTVQDEHFGQWHALAHQLINQLVSASQQAEGLNELGNALGLLELPPHLEAMTSDDHKEQIQNLRQRLQRSQTVQSDFQRIRAARSASSSSALQQLLDHAPVSETSVSAGTWQMIVEEVNVLAQEIISQIQQNLELVQLIGTEALLDQLLQLEANYSGMVKSLADNIDTLSSSYANTSAQLAELDAELTHISAGIPGNMMDPIETLLNLYPSQMLAQRAKRIDELLQKVIKQRAMKILLNSNHNENWRIAVESLASLWQLIILHSTVVLSQSSEEFQKVEEKAWENIRKVFGITSTIQSLGFVKKHESVLHQNPDSLFYLARLFEKAGHRGAARRLYRTLGEKTDDEEIKKRCKSNIDRIDKAS